MHNIHIIFYMQGTPGWPTRMCSEDMPLTYIVFMYIFYNHYKNTITILNFFSILLPDGAKNLVRAIKTLWTNLTLKKAHIHAHYLFHL